MEFFKNMIWLFSLLIVLFLAGSFYIDAKEVCNKKGGALVRGVIGFECVAGARVK